MSFFNIFPFTRVKFSNTKFKINNINFRGICLGNKSEFEHVLRKSKPSKKVYMGKKKGIWVVGLITKKKFFFGNLSFVPNTEYSGISSRKFLSETIFEKIIFRIKLAKIISSNCYRKNVSQKIFWKNASQKYFEIKQKQKYFEIIFRKNLIQFFLQWWPLKSDIPFVTGFPVKLRDKSRHAVTVRDDSTN